MSFKVPPDFDVVDDISACDTDPNTEVYLLRVPKGIDVEKLNGVKFSQHRVKEIETDESVGDLAAVYELTPFTEQVLDEQLLISEKGSHQLGPSLSGLLSMTKSYRASEASSASSTTPCLPPQGPVPMPEGLNVRFKPFGADDPVKIPHAKRSKHKSGKNNKKDKELTHESDKSKCTSNFSGKTSQHEDWSMFSSLSSADEGKKSKSKKSKKKRKHDAEGEESIFVSPRKKSKKHHKSHDHMEDVMFIDKTGSGSDRLLDGSGDALLHMSNGLASPVRQNLHWDPIVSFSITDETQDIGHLSKSEKKKKHKKNKKSSKDKQNSTL